MLQMPKVDVLVPETLNPKPETRNPKPETAAMPRVRSTSLLLVLFIFVFALFGVQLFAGVSKPESRNPETQA